MNFEKAFLSVLMETALTSRQDQYGNIQESLLAVELRRWAEKNREDIASEVVKLFKKEQFAEAVAKKVVEELTKSSSWSTNYEAQRMKDSVNKIVAEKLAEKQLERLNSLSNKE
jgi:hypothetical protein